MPYRPSFNELTDRYGEVMAWQYLIEIERAAGVRPKSWVIDPEQRLANALRAQDRIAKEVPLLLVA